MYIDFNTYDDYDIDQIHLFQGHELFYNFLVNFNIINEFIDEYYKDKMLWKRKNWSIYDNVYDINEYLNVTKDVLFIERAFNWRNTKKGRYYWLGIHMKWQSYKKQYL